ncbi:MAG: HEAT repeat domain-containing protein [Myxococcaceae bacterium]|nr:HEAT repeat domain-containing protein [Myxococcaceae bacterium]
MSQERPDALLKSALEKIVYFEARAAQLTNDLDTANAERARLRGELGHASQRELELRRVIAELEVRSTRAHQEREEAATVAEALRRERAELLGKILEASRLNTDGHDPFDLASFIAELRSEVLLRRERDQGGATPVLVNVTSASAATPAGLTSGGTSRGVGQTSTSPTPPTAEPAPSHVTKTAEALEAQGRLTVSKEDLASLERAFPFAGRSEETLFGFSVRELSAPDAAARARAAERLTALAHPAAAPALATALHAEREASVKVALLTALSALAKVEAVPVVLPQLSSASPEVRIAALKALLKLDPAQAGPHLAAAVKDPDSAVRRRASLLALGLRGTAALELGETAIRDENADVRSLAALVLGASGLESARPWLMQAMRDPELRVRRSASQAMSRLLGQDVSQLVELDEAQRRREVRRLAQVPANPVKAKLVAALPQPPLPPQAAVERAHAATTVSAAPALHRLAPIAPPQSTTSVGAAAAARATGTGVPTQSTTGVGPGPGAPSLVPATAPQLQTTGGQTSPADLQPLRAAQRTFPAVAAVAAVSQTSRVAVAVVEETARSPDPVVLSGVLVELRAAIRGQPADALASALSTSLESVRAACAALMEQGQIVRRGHKYFVA